MVLFFQESVQDIVKDQFKGVEQDDQAEGAAFISDLFNSLYYFFGSVI